MRLARLKRPLAVLFTGGLLTGCVAPYAQDAGYDPYPGGYDYAAYDPYHDRAYDPYGYGPYAYPYPPRAYGYGYAHEPVKAKPVRRGQGVGKAERARRKAERGGQQKRATRDPEKKAQRKNGQRRGQRMENPRNPPPVQQPRRAQQPAPRYAYREREEDPIDLNRPDDPRVDRFLQRRAAAQDGK